MPNLGGVLFTSLVVHSDIFCRNGYSLCLYVAQVTFKVDRARQSWLCHSKERTGEFLRLCRLKCSDFNPVSKPPPIGKFPQAHCIREDNLKGLSYSERDTCKSLSRDDHAAAAAVALVEALIGQVGIWETGVKSKPQWSFLPRREHGLIPPSRRQDFLF